MSKRLLTIATFIILVASCSNDNGKHKTYSGIMDVNSVRVSVQTPGLITTLQCEEGISVQQGQVLAIIETEKLDYQIDQSKSVLDELNHQYESASAQLKAATITSDNIKTKYERFSALLKAHAATQQSIDDLKTQLDAANEQLRSAEAALSVITSKKKQIDAGMKISKKQIKDATIISPLAGTILVRYAEHGELVTIGSPICEIANLSEMWTKIYLSEKDLHSVKLGQKVQIKVDGITDKTFDGIITWISDKSEFTPKTILTEETRTTLVYPAKVTIKNSDGIFKIGMPVSVLVERGS